MRNPYHVARTLVAVVFFVALAGCRLFSDVDGIALRDADADMVSPADDGPGSDLTSDTSMEPDLGLVIDPATIFELIRGEVCDYYARQNYHGSIFLGVGFRDRAGCFAFFDVFLRNLVGMLARDVEEGRAVLDEENTRALIEHVRTYSGDPRVFPINDVAALVTPLAGIGGACSSAFACVSTPQVAATCYLASPTDCDGICVRATSICGATRCAADEFCAQGSCNPSRLDGQACMNDTECVNRCLSGICGTLADGDNCMANPADCGPNSYCQTLADPDVCAPIGILNDECPQDAGCVPGNYCDLNTRRCAALGEGTPCRGATCTAGLSCVATSAADATRRCFAPRAIGETCGGDPDCASGSYCNLSECTAAKAVGESCRGDRECESICRFERSDDVIGACAIFRWGLPEGAACHVDAARCGMGMECETTGSNVLSGVCVVQQRPAVGAACNTSRPAWCADDSFCIGGVCTPVSSTGEACSAHLECRSGTCAGTCFDRLDACVTPPS